jgi:C-terminal processing protease CtpA/Prc
MRLREKRTNSGFEKVEILPGNVGYISFTYFGDPEAGAAKMGAAMQFVADTEALIIDLRRNGGATHLALMDLLTRYLVEDSKIVTAKTKWRGEAPDFIKNPIVLPTTAPRYLEKPVYLLTSQRTFSGAEGFAYNLQAIKRVTIVGERTGGGANPGGELRACDHFAVWVPAGIVEHPITKTNWEGVGIIPEMEVDVDRAHLHAHVAAIDSAIRKAGDDSHWQKHLEEQKAKVEKQLAHREPTRTIEFRLAGHPDAKKVTVYGSFNDWSGRKADMKRQGEHWKVTLDLPFGRHSYKFRIDDEWITDPNNPTLETTADGYTNSVIDVSK